MQFDQIDDLYQRQIENGGPIRTLTEWRELLPAMYDSLVNRAETMPYGELPIFYKDLGAEIGLPYMPEYEWWPLKMAHLLGACARFEHINGRPMLTSIVVSGDSGQPGNGFWGIDGIPGNLGIRSRVEDQLTSITRDDRREAYWIEELRRVNQYWNPN